MIDFVHMQTMAESKECTLHDWRMGCVRMSRLTRATHLEIDCRRSFGVCCGYEGRCCGDCRATRRDAQPRNSPRSR